MGLAGLVKYGKRGSTYTGGISTTFAVVNNAWMVMWNDQVLRVLDTREEAEHYASQLTTEGVIPLHPRQEKKRQEAKLEYCDFCEHPRSVIVGRLRQDPSQRVCEVCAADPRMSPNIVPIKEGILGEAINIMAEDPGFKAAAREREIEAKKNKLKFGRQLFRVGDSVINHDREAIPWVGLVMSAEYRDHDIDGAGWYYEVDWWNDKLSQRHQGYAHQDFLRPL